MSDILLAHSYFLRFDPKAWKQMKPYPPLGTLYIARVLRDAGHTVRFFDPMFAASEDEIEPHLRSFRPEVTMFFEDNFNYHSKMCLTRMREACFRMAGTAREYGSTVIAQGSDPVDHLSEYFRNHVDFVICGEGERTAPELVQALPDGDLDTISGIAFPTGGGPRVTPKRTVVRDLDDLPFPAWDLLDVESYRAVWKKRHGYFSLNLVTTRGCPYHCNWCAKPVYGQGYNSRSPENVVEELDYLRATLAPDHIWFSDDILGLKPGWLRRFSDLVNKRGIRTPFSCQTRADLMLREDNAEHIAHAGAETVWVGAESGSQQVLDSMEKGTTIGEIREATRRLQSRGVRVAWFLQFGYPGERRTDIQQTLDLVRACKPDDIGISVSYPLPGTKFYERVKGWLVGKQNWVDSGDLDLMFPGTYHPSFYRALHTAVHHEFRMRQGLRMLLHPFSAPADIRRMALLPWHIIRLLTGRLAMVVAGRRRPLHPALSLQPAS